MQMTFRKSKIYTKTPFFLIPFEILYVISEKETKTNKYANIKSTNLQNSSKRV